MSTRRIEKLNHAILESVSSTILFSLRDPRIKNVTVTRVETAPDTRTAKVYVSVMGDETEQRLCLHGLESARGFLQKKVADRIQTRFTPVLQFVLDQGVKKSILASRLIRESLADGVPLPGDPLPGNVPYGSRVPLETTETATATVETAEMVESDDEHASAPEDASGPAAEDFHDHETSPDEDATVDRD